MLVHKAIADETVTVAGASAVGDFIHAGDVARAIADLLDAPALNHDVYNIAYGQPTTLSELADTVVSTVPGFAWSKTTDDDATLTGNPSRMTGAWGAYNIMRNYILDGIVGPPYSGSIERSRDMAKAPGRSDREGLTLIELMQIFPTEDHGRQCRQWFESHIWPDGRHCPHCGSTDTTGNKGNEARPYHCRDCKRHFSVRIGTLLERSKISYRKWAIAIYLHMTVLKGVSGMKLHRGFGDHAKDRVVHAPAHSQGVR